MILSARHFHCLALLLLGAKSTTLCLGAIWARPGWVLSSEIVAEAGYDSNLYLRRGSPADGFISAEPRLLLSRRASVTHFVSTLAVRGTGFFDQSQENFVDPRVSVAASWPAGVEVPPRFEGNAELSRITEPIAEVGKMVSRRQLQATGEVRIVEREKLALTSRVFVESQDYSSSGLYSNEAALLRAGLLYTKNERLAWGLRYGVGWKQTEASNSNHQLRAFEQLLQIGGRGEFLPKISGSAYFGVTRVSYSSERQPNQNEFVGDADLTWQIDEMTKGVLRTERSIYFNALGETTVANRHSLSFTRQFRGRYTLTASGGYQTRKSGIDASSREDRAWSFSAGMEYRLTERFSASLIPEFSDQDSSLSVYAFERWRTVANLYFRF